MPAHLLQVWVAAPGVLPIPAVRKTRGPPVVMVPAPDVGAAGLGGRVLDGEATATVPHEYSR